MASLRRKRRHCEATMWPHNDYYGLPLSWEWVSPGS
jgi:hypothetical protein